MTTEINILNQDLPTNKKHTYSKRYTDDEIKSIHYDENGRKILILKENVCKRFNFSSEDLSLE